VSAPLAAAVRLARTLTILAVLGAPPALAAAPTARASLDPAGLRRAVATQRPAFEACVSRAATQQAARVEGRRVTLRLTLLPTGRVARSALLPRALRGESLGRCLAAAGQRLVVAPFSGAAVDLELPLALSVAR
jgi:hypothetical protein